MLEPIPEPITEPMSTGADIVTYLNRPARTAQYFFVHKLSLTQPSYYHLSLVSHRARSMRSFYTRHADIKFRREISNSKNHT